MKDKCTCAFLTIDDSKERIHSVTCPEHGYKNISLTTTGSSKNFHITSSSSSTVTNETESTAPTEFSFDVIDDNSASENSLYLRLLLPPTVELNCPSVTIPTKNFDTKADSMSQNVVREEKKNLADEFSDYEMAGAMEKPSAWPSVPLSVLLCATIFCSPIMAVLMIKKLGTTNGGMELAFLWTAIGVLAVIVTPLLGHMRQKRIWLKRSKCMNRMIKFFNRVVESVQKDGASELVSPYKPKVAIKLPEDAPMPTCVCGKEWHMEGMKVMDGYLIVEDRGKARARCSTCQPTGTKEIRATL